MTDISKTLRPQPIYELFESAKIFLLHRDTNFDFFHVSNLFFFFEERKDIFFSKSTSQKNVKTCCLRLSISTAASLWLIIRRSNWESPPVNTDKGWSDTSWSLAAAAARLIYMKPPELGVNPTPPELRLRRWNTHFWGRLSFHSLKILHAFFFPFLFCVFLFPSTPIPISSKHL